MATKAERIAERVATEINVWAASKLATVTKAENDADAEMITFKGDGYAAEQLIILVRPALGGRVDTATWIRYYPAVWNHGTGRHRGKRSPYQPR